MQLSVALCICFEMLVFSFKMDSTIHILSQSLMQQRLSLKTYLLLVIEPDLYCFSDTHVGLSLTKGRATAKRGPSTDAYCLHSMIFYLAYSAASISFDGCVMH